VLTFTVYTDSLCKVVLNWALIQAIMSFSASDVPSVSLPEGCNMAVCLALITPDWLRNIRLYLISEKSDVNKLGEFLGN